MPRISENGPAPARKGQINANVIDKLAFREGREGLGRAANSLHFFGAEPKAEDDVSCFALRKLGNGRHARFVDDADGAATVFGSGRAKAAMEVIGMREKEHREWTANGSSEGRVCTYAADVACAPARVGEYCPRQHAHLPAPIARDAGSVQRPIVGQCGKHGFRMGTPCAH